VEPLIKASTEYATNPKEPGLCYCRGLFYKWSLKPKEALTELNIAKRN
jgi:tetratricopeptide repeat protein 21B